MSSINTSNTSSKPKHAPYIGRFAPSPSGPLHFGSLVSALASYLDAHHQHGKWLVRMEDLDPPREQAGAATAILKCLEDYGLHWDDTVVYQSRRSDIYDEFLDRLQQQDLVYPCTCTRQNLQTMNGIYNGYCRHRSIDLNRPHALRLKLYDLPTRLSHNNDNAHNANLHNANLHNDTLHFVDLIQGEQIQNLRTQAGDQIIKRKDGFYAYQLAVVADDIAQGITHIIRGSDLLDATARQIFLFELSQTPTSASTPAFGHVTLANQLNGQKLSKQNHAPALDINHTAENLWQALMFLGQNPPLELYKAVPSELLMWAKIHWQRTAIHGLSAIYTPTVFSPRNHNELNLDAL